MTAITTSKLRLDAGKWFVKGYVSYGLCVFSAVLLLRESSSWIPWAIVACLAFINGINFMKYGDDLLVVASAMENGDVKISSK